MEERLFLGVFGGKKGVITWLVDGEFVVIFVVYAVRDCGIFVG
jgi:hypothetical protein